MDNQFTQERNRIKSVFNTAALIYPLIEIGLMPQYRKALYKLKLSNNFRVLDFATGTGILAGTFHERGHEVRGLDFSTKLLKQARKKFTKIEFIETDLYEINIDLMPKVEIVSMGYLLHGLSPDLRKIILQKAAILATEYVVVFDHTDKTNWIIKFIEYLEGSYYNEFITSDHKQLFSSAGLKIIKEFAVDDFGYCWLCGKE